MSSVFINHVSQSKSACWTNCFSVTCFLGPDCSRFPSSLSVCLQTSFPDADTPLHHILGWCHCPRAAQTDQQLSVLIPAFWEGQSSWLICNQVHSPVAGAGTWCRITAQTQRQFSEEGGAISGANALREFTVVIRKSKTAPWSFQHPKPEFGNSSGATEHFPSWTH